MPIIYHILLMKVIDFRYRTNLEKKINTHIAIISDIFSETRVVWSFNLRISIISRFFRIIRDRYVTSLFFWFFFLRAWSFELVHVSYHMRNIFHDQIPDLKMIRARHVARYYWNACDFDKDYVVVRVKIHISIRNETLTRRKDVNIHIFDEYDKENKYIFSELSFPFTISMRFYHSWYHI